MSCPDCFTGSVLEGTPTGVISDIDSAYFASGSPDGNSNTKRNDYRLKLNNPKIIADQFALHLKCDVWVPDFFQGHPPVNEFQMKSLPDRAGKKLGVFGLLRTIAVALPSIPSFISNRGSVVDARVVSFIKKIQEQKKYEKIGVIGYCFGGGIASRVGAATNIFDSIVLAHQETRPTPRLTPSRLAPTAWAQPEEDMGISAERLKKIEELYASRKGKDTYVDYEIQVYKAHGFAARPNFAYPDVKAGFEGAFKQAVEWYNKTIPGQALVAISNSRCTSPLLERPTREHRAAPSSAREFSGFAMEGDQVSGMMRFGPNERSQTP
ncbi:DLH domain-containing protein [Favolaschia claudopus]|uniref:DLH domain-containing protein n=1 Tax=Favolaschia claudopus TaxID=2862362 RepID=A0AAW0DBN7_9AGAR